ncbi:hypothetical protein PSA01_59820 [Pseudonocardia saturnea]|uniref:Uncharacterized protein n=1 Tax=Pseudonocardia saturnea TaxID=33909 RepID=A0ABQ0S7P7_9PSEU|nr:hypothetical protein PSA01_59820 [Pseudonocardia saturnea]
MPHGVQLDQGLGARSAGRWCGGSRTGHGFGGRQHGPIIASRIGHPREAPGGAGSAAAAARTPLSAAGIAACNDDAGAGTGG